MFENPLLKQIDEVLVFISNKEGGILEHELFNHFCSDDKITNEFLKLIIGKLIKDRYVEDAHLAWGDDFWAGYKITFEGKIFAAQYGYSAIEWGKMRTMQDAWTAQSYTAMQINLLETQTESMKAQVKLMEQQTKLQTSVRSLTTWITIGTIIAAVYYAMEIGIWICTKNAG